jgi:hypothetical protein
VSAPPPAPASVPTTASEALRRLGHPGEVPTRPVVRGAAGELVTYPAPEAGGRIAWHGLFRAAGRIELVGAVPAYRGFSEAQGLTGRSAEVADGLAEVARTYLESAAELDTRLAAVQQRGRTAPLGEVWALGREAARLRGHIGRALAALVEIGRLPEAELPGLAPNLPPLQTELARVQDVARAVEQGVTDLILLRNAEEANRLAETANQLGRLSNRIAELQNISNIRMLGLTYIALVLALLGGVLLIPNTAATILGMPSAGWVPGLWVDLLLAGLIAGPLLYVFSRPWVRELLHGFSSYEFRAREGMTELPEVGRHEPAPPDAPTAPPR